MEITHEVINCQVPTDLRNIRREFSIVHCTINKGSEEYTILLNKALQLASNVNAAAANNSLFERDVQRRKIDAFGGILAEAGWEQFINLNFGSIAAPTPFEGSAAQIDIKLTKGELIEVRSSFPRNGVRFAICNDRFNFRNIGPYSNTVKPGEIQKHFYLAVLFDTPKEELLNSNSIVFTLVGGSTWQRMIDFGYSHDLKPENDYFAVRSKYRVVDLKNALDADQVIAAIGQMGYPRVATS